MGALDTTIAMFRRNAWWTFRIFCIFFLLGGGEGGVWGGRGGGLKIPGGGGVSQREGGGRGGREGVCGDFRGGGGWAKYFFQDRNVHQECVTPQPKCSESWDLIAVVLCDCKSQITSDLRQYEASLKAI